MEPAIFCNTSLPKRVQIIKLLSDGQWWTIVALNVRTGGMQTTTSAKLRESRWAKYGGYEIESRVKPGSSRTWQYRMTARDIRLYYGMKVEP